ncbi:MAG: Holliday junction resolvase RuvX [Anaerolineae bacterium]|nr:Holliday junction resolvase RuvX [Anaerolineae bacterium]
MTRWLGIDHGLRVLGVAISDPLGMLARPLRLVVRRAKAEDFALLAGLVEMHGVEGIVVGLPVNPEGGENKQEASVRKWAGRLAAAIPVPVWLWDESFSSFEAAQRLAGRRGSDARIDDAAAAVILQAFLDARREDPAAGEPVLPGDDG